MYKIINFKKASIQYNKLTHGVYCGRILPFINLFLYTNLQFFEPFSNIIINLGYPISVMLVNGIPNTGLRRWVISRRVISIINKKRRKVYRGKRCVIIYKLGH